ncbi:MAG: hypothetical protein U0270_40895 [Labilithrix sp.]
MTNEPGDQIDEAIQLGRRLREGTFPKEPAMKTEALSESSLEAAALARIDAVEPSNLAAAAEARDAAESLLVVLGHLGAAEAERRVAARLAEADAKMLARRDEWSASAVTGDAWLRRIAALDASSWWLDLVALSALREAAKAFDPAFAFRDGPRPAIMKLRARAHTTAASQRLYAEVVGMDDDPARLALERGAVVARLFDGEIEVFAIGLRPDQDDLPAGLCVVRRGGGVAGITHVALGGVVAGQGQSGWWASIPQPLAKPGTMDLVVRMGDREEALAIELVA